MISRMLLVAAFLLLPELVLGQGTRGFDPILAPRREPPIPSSLSPEAIEELRAGIETISPAAAEHAGLPQPARALALASELVLSAEQVAEIEALASVALDDARRLGRGIIEQETRLDSLFAVGDPRDWTVRPVVIEIGRLRTELRYVHLRARMRMQEILSAEQQRRYAELAAGRPRAGSVRE